MLNSTCIEQQSHTLVKTSCIFGCVPARRDLLNPEKLSGNMRATEVAEHPQNDPAYGSKTGRTEPCYLTPTTRLTSSQTSHGETKLF